MKKEIEEAIKQTEYNRNLERFNQQKFKKHTSECAYGTSFLGKDCSCPDEAKRQQVIQCLQFVAGVVVFLLVVTIPIWIQFLK